MTLLTIVSLNGQGYGKEYQRKVWRKLHIGVDKEGQIVTRMLASHRTDDRTCVKVLLDPLPLSLISEVLAEGGYDSHQLYQDLEKVNVKPLIPPPAKAVVSASEQLTLRDKTVQYIKDKGYWLGIIKMTSAAEIKLRIPSIG